MFFVSASTYTYSIDNSKFEPLTANDFWTVKNYSDNFLIQNPTFTSYLITYNSSNSEYTIHLSNAIGGTLGFYNTSSSRQFRLPFVFNSGSTLYRKDTYNAVTHNFTSGTVGSPPSYIAQSWINTQNPWPLNATVLYANYNFTYIYANTLEFNYLNTTYSWGSNDTYPTLYDLYIRLYPDFSPSVEDPYPTLTNFINIVIDRFLYITDFFVNSYLYLSIFVIFLFIFFIFLLKRRFY